MKLCYNSTVRVVGYKCRPLNSFIVTGIVSIDLVADSIVISIIFTLVSVLLMAGHRKS